MGNWTNFLCYHQSVDQIFYKITSLFALHVHTHTKKPSEPRSACYAVCTDSTQAKNSGPDLFCEEPERYGFKRFWGVLPMVFCWEVFWGVWLTRNFQNGLPEVQKTQLVKLKSATRTFLPERTWGCCSGRSGQRVATETGHLWWVYPYRDTFRGESDGGFCRVFLAPFLVLNDPFFHKLNGNLVTLLAMAQMNVFSFQSKLNGIVVGLVLGHNQELWVYSKICMNGQTLKIAVKFAIAMLDGNSSATLWILAYLTRSRNWLTCWLICRGAIINQPQLNACLKSLKLVAG